MAVSLDRIAVVYQATNLVNGHRYIGFTIQGLKVREAKHRAAARHPTKGYHFHKAIRKFGQENFVFKIMAEFEDEELGKLYEREAIEAYLPEYNLSGGGEGGSMPAITRQRISASNKGRVGPMKGKRFTAEHKAKLSLAATGRPNVKLRGRPLGEERRRKIGLANRDKISNVKGKTRSEESIKQMLETKRLLRLANPGYPALGGRLKGAPLRKPVLCVTDGARFESIRAAAAHYDVYVGSIRQALNGRRDSVRGKVFSFIEAAE